MEEIYKTLSCFVFSRSWGVGLGLLLLGIGLGLLDVGVIVGFSLQVLRLEPLLVRLFFFLRLPWPGSGFGFLRFRLDL